MKKWEIRTKVANTKQTVADIIDLLLANRGFTKTSDINTFLHPELADVTIKHVGIDENQLQKTLKRIKTAIDTKEQIVVFGDYDVDGITGSAILWETLHSLGATVTPYIPHRVDEGYGLSIKGIENLKEQLPTISLIITTDNGIVANKAVAFANEQGIDVIITDHHTVGETLPEAFAIVHTTQLCGAGVAYMLSKEIRRYLGEDPHTTEDTHLELAALGTIADLVPLTGANRTLVTYGLEKLSKTKRVGLKALYQQAGIEKDTIGVYEVGYIIAPRLNASGRIESAMDSLRLLCTTKHERAALLAEKLEMTNRERQLLMRKAAEHAKDVVTKRDALKNVLIVAHEDYQPGVIGLVAGKLVEEFYRPAIVLSVGETHSKASARSITGFNIIEFLRSGSAHLVDVGGHPMAAGFTVETKKLPILQEFLESSADTLVTEELLIRSLKIDCEIPLTVVTNELYQALHQLAPFGMANPEPVFATRGVTILDVRVIGKEGNHLKLVLSDKKSQPFDAIAFGMGELGDSLKRGSSIDIAYTMDENTWNGETKLQLKLKDINL